ncbi:hypothetical protein HPB48_005309 [Haemaphysalis longicornis]|uniref:Major facilitator superfamily (MFS) profile domain-containing protein n=1 Tax=Haemaphysalis longicornis TaxID=44386 RepID=A0A9J6GHM8_HAELO|nr:hypothetical protein HPB48_005309 [Haemaphysalis longicornis]
MSQIYFGTEDAMASHGAPNAKVPTAPVIGAVTPKAGTSGVAPLAASPESLNPRMPPNNAMPEQGPMPPQGASKSTLNLLAPGSDGIETPEGPVVAVKQVSSGSAKRLPGNLLGMSSPVPFLRPMTLGAGGTPQLVGVPESWRLRLDTAGDRPLREPSPPRLDSSLHEPKAEPNSPAEALPTSAELQCGFLWYRPAWLQGFRTPGWVLGSLCAIEFTQSFVTNGVLGVVLPTIERRFSLSSYETGLILSSFNVVNGLFIVPVAFLGSTRNKPLIISAGMAITAAGSLMYFLAYALAPPYTYGAVPPDLCYAAPLLANETRDTCKEESIRDYRIFLFSGSMMHGAGVTPLHTLGISFLDENLPLKFTSLFVGTYSAMAVLGPAFGFLVAGYFLSVFVDLTDVSS